MSLGDLQCERKWHVATEFAIRGSSDQHKLGATDVFQIRAFRNNSAFIVSFRI
jgi:hypothetical protein